MDLRYLRFFIAVAEEMNFTRAAERLKTVQPSVSRQIHRLEEIIGTPLFRRERHKLDMTEAGRVFLKESRAILEHMDRAIALARQSASPNAGHLAIGFILGTEGLLFPRLVPAMRKSFPKIELSYKALPEIEQLIALEKGSINAAFTAGPIDNPAIATEFVMHQKLVVVLPIHHPLTCLRRIPVARLAEYPLICPTLAMVPNYMSVINGIAQTAQVQFKMRFEHDNVLSALTSLRIGTGICLIPSYQKNIFSSHLTSRPLDLDPQPSLDLLVAYRKDDRLPALSCFLSVVRESMNKLLLAPEDAGGEAGMEQEQHQTLNPNREAGDGAELLPEGKLPLSSLPKIRKRPRGRLGNDPFGLRRR